MLEQAVRKVIAILLVVIYTSTLLMAERPTAMLYATGAVTLNGLPAAKSMSVMAGDRIDTANASAVSINRSGLSLVIDSNSSVQYQSSGFTVLRGKASARASNGMSAHVGPLSVIPRGNSALFDVISDGKTVLVVSRDGTLNLTDGVDTATLVPGYMAKVILDPQDQDPKPAAPASGEVQQREYPKPQATSSDQDQGPKPAATTSGDQDNRKKRLIILIVASAAAAATVICILECGQGGPTPISPVTP